MQFDGAISLLSNTAQSGGAILAVNGKIMFNGETTITSRDSENNDPIFTADHCPYITIIA